MTGCFLSNSLSLMFLITFYRQTVEICEYVLFKSLDIFPVPLLKTLAKIFASMLFLGFSATVLHLAFFIRSMEVLL